MLKLEGPVKIEFNFYGLIVFPRRVDESQYNLTIDSNEGRQIFTSRNARTVDTTNITNYVFVNEVEISIKSLQSSEEDINIEMRDSCVLISDIKYQFNNVNISCTNNCVIDYFKIVAKSIHLSLDNSIMIMDVRNNVKLDGNVINSSSVIIHHPNSVDVQCNIDNDSTSTVTINSLNYKLKRDSKCEI